MKRTYNHLASLLLLVAMFAMSNVAKAQLEILSDGWEFKSVYPAPGNVESITRLQFQLPYGMPFVNSGTEAYIVDGEENPVAKVSIDSYNNDGTCVGKLSQPITDLGYYKLMIDSGTLSLGNGDNGGGVFMCGPMTYEWTIQYQPRDGWTFTSVIPEEGEVKSLSHLTFTLPAGVEWTNFGLAQAEIWDTNGNSFPITIYDKGNGTCEADFTPITAPGEYRLEIMGEAFAFGNGDFGSVYNSGPMFYTWTIRGGKCATPTISYVDGKLKFECETPNAQFYSTVSLINDGNISTAGPNVGDEIPLAPKYFVRVYASAAGYEDSDDATKEITISASSAAKAGDVNGDGVVNMQDAVDLIDIYLGNGGE